MKRENARNSNPPPKFDPFSHRRTQERLDGVDDSRTVDVKEEEAKEEKDMEEEEKEGEGEDEDEEAMVTWGSGEFIVLRDRAGTARGGCTGSP